MEVEGRRTVARVFVEGGGGGGGDWLTGRGEGGVEYIGRSVGR